MSDSLPVILETAPCSFCSSSEAEALFSGPDRLLGLPGVFTVVRCLQCGLLRQDPRPTLETIGFYYPPEYDPYSIAIEDEPTRWRRFDRRYGMWKRRRAIERHLPGGRLLDVGCATGNFLYEMARSGRWEVEGVEPSREAASYAQQRMGLKVHVGRLAEAGLPAASFDVVTMWNVLEHLHDPLANLQMVGQLLKPGGLFVFCIPNVEGIEAKACGRYWLGWELPRHLHFYPRSVLESKLDTMGMTVLSWHCLAGAYPSFLLTLRFMLEGRRGETWWTRGTLTLAHFLPTRLAVAPIFWLLATSGQASLVSGFARRKVA